MWDFILFVKQDISDKTWIAFSEFAVLTLNWAEQLKLK